MDKRILIIDDDLESCKFLAEIFSSEGWQIEWAQTPERALILANKKPFDLIVSDINLEAKISGIELLKEFKSSEKKPQVILISGFGTLETAVKAVQEGAFDFISKPFKVKEVIDTARRALETRNENAVSKDVSNILKHYESSNLIGRSSQMLSLYNDIAHVAPSKSTVLIIGDSGTGKELVARSIHNHSNRNQKPFVAINCGALTETLLESELFGHIKGSFTGATNDKKGLFEEADSGTIFLDEIGETSLSLQVKLLRVLQEGEIKQVGSAKSIKVDVRVIAATNRDLELSVKEGRFREDLYYRLGVVTLHVPRLKERIGDIPLLSAHFIKKHPPENKQSVLLSDQALEALLSYDWPGNVRELENAIEHAVIYAKSNIILLEDFPQKIQRSVSDGSIQKSSYEKIYQDLPSLDELQKRYLLYVLEATAGNRTKAAEIMQIDRRTLYRMAERYGIILEE